MICVNKAVLRERHVMPTVDDECSDNILQVGPQPRLSSTRVNTRIERCDNILHPRLPMALQEIELRCVVSIGNLPVYNRQSAKRHRRGEEHE